MRFLLFSYIFTIIVGSPIDYDPYNLYAEAFTIEPDQPEQPNVPETQTPAQSIVALGNEDTTLKTNFNFIDNSLAGQNDATSDDTSDEMLQFSTQPDSTSLMAKKPPVERCYTRVAKIEVPCWVLSDVSPLILVVMAGSTFIDILLVRLQRRISAGFQKAIEDVRSSDPPKPPNQPTLPKNPHVPDDATLAREFKEAVEKFKLKKQKPEEEPKPEDETPEDPDVKSFQKYIQFLDTNDHVWLQKTVEDSLVESGKASRDEGLAKTALLCIDALEVVGPWLLLF